MSRDQSIRYGDLAIAVLENDAFKAAIETIQNEIIQEWRKTTKVEERECLFLSEKMLGRVLVELNRLASEGKMEAANLKRANSSPLQIFGR